MNRRFTLAQPLLYALKAFYIENDDTRRERNRMKRVLTAALCALLLLGMLPLTGRPAQMITSFTVNTWYNPPVYVGDEINWWVSIEDGIGPYSYSYDIYRGNVLHRFDPDYHDGLWDYYWTADTSGSIRAMVWVWDEGDSSGAVEQSEFVPVYLRNAPRFYKLTYNGTSGNSAYFEWYHVYGADGYEVHRSRTRFGGYSLVGTTTSDRFYNYGLTPGVQYFYKVRTYNMINGVRVPSGKFSAAYAVVPLAKPTIYSLYSSGANRVTLNFSRVTGASAYRIYRGYSLYGTYAHIRTVTSTSAIITGVTPGRTHYFYVLPYRQLYPRNYYGPPSNTWSIYKTAR